MPNQQHQQTPSAAHAKTPELSVADLVVGGTYRAKRFWSHAFDSAITNDRTILWMSPPTGDLTFDQVQYDSYTVRTGAKYPKVSVAEFLRWARCRAVVQP